MSNPSSICQNSVRTLWYLHALHGLIVHCACPLLDELVPLDANVKDLRAGDAERDKLFHRGIDDICSSL